MFVHNFLKSLSHGHSAFGKKFFPYGLLLLFLVVISVSAQIIFEARPQSAWNSDGVIPAIFEKKSRLSRTLLLLSISFVYIYFRFSP
ncbi:hypothetical protein L0Y49_00790, partial [bacterium]|nr:hypothetical protein [bacterium]